MPTEAQVQDSPPIADGVVRSLDPRHVTLERVAGRIATACVSAGLAIGAVIVLLVTPLPAWLDLLLVGGWAVVTLVMGWWLHRWPEIVHRHASYVVEPEGIEIRRGVFWRAITRVPRSRVQHTDVLQGPLERRYGLGTLVIYTAGTAHSRVDLAGLEHGTALRIRNHLLPEDATDAV